MLQPPARNPICLALELCDTAFDQELTICCAACDALPTSDGRSRAYREGDDFAADASWNASQVGGDGPYPWTSADDSDPAFPYNDKLPAELYNLDGAP